MDENNDKTIHPLFPKPLSIAKVITPLKYKREVVRVVERLGEVEPIMVDPRAGVDQMQVEDRRNEVETLRTKLNSYLATLDKKLISKGEKVSVGHSEDEVLDYIKEVVDKQGVRIAEIISRRDAIASRQTELKNLTSLLQRFQQLSIDSTMMSETAHTKTYLGTVYPPQIHRLMWTLDEITDSKYFFLEKEVVHNEESAILVSVLQKDAEVVGDKLKAMSVQEIAIPNDVDFDGLSISDCEAEAETLKNEDAELLTELESIAKESGSVYMAAMELCTIELERINIELKMRRTETTCVMWAWMPEHLIEKFKSEISASTDGAASFDFRGGDFDPSQTPSYVTNSEFMQPVRAVSSSFGSPSLQEVDPFPFVKFLLPLFFGIMFADVGHGFIFMMIGIWARQKKKKMDEVPEGLMGYLYGGPELIIMMGATAMILGIPFNSIFGDETLLWQVPIFRATFEHTTWALFFNVVDHGTGPAIERDYFAFLIFSFAVGAVVILLGLAVNIYQLSKYRHGDAELQAAIALFLGYLLIVVAAVFIAVQLATVGMIIIGVGAVSLIATAVIEKRAHGIDGLMLAIDHILSLLSNTFSFGRLLAMNTVHFVLAFLPYLFVSLIPEYKYVLNHYVDHWVPSDLIWLWVICAIIGSLIVVPVEGVFSTLQALRLNWVEFFGKFFKGTGVDFKPVKVKRVFTVEQLS